MVGKTSFLALSCIQHYSVSVANHVIYSRDHLQLTGTSFGKMVFKCEGIRKRILRFFTKQINSLWEWILRFQPLTHHDPRDLGWICLQKKREICFRSILSVLRMQSSRNKPWCFACVQINRPFYSCVLSYLAMDASEAGGDLALIQTSQLFSCKCQLVSIGTTWFAQYNQWGLYQNKVNSSLALIQRLGH